MASQVYAIGSNGAGQLGIGHKEDVSVPKPVILNGIHNTQTAITVRAGGNHTLLLDSNGKLFSAGDSVAGARGLTPPGGFDESTFQPVLFSASQSEMRQITHCAATWETSIIVAKASNDLSDKVYSFGTGNKGELGQGEMIFRSPTAGLISNFPPTGTEVVDIAASVGHVVVVLDNGEAYGWGTGRKGQLGEVTSVVYTPRKINGVDFHVTRVVCGREFTLLFGRRESGVYAFLGADKWDIQGSLPPRLPEWTNVGAGWGHVYIQKNDGKLLSYGRDDHGQSAPADLPPLYKLAVGSEHCVGLTADGRVVAWGWGEHGNCGPETINGDVKGTWNVVASSDYLPSGAYISSIGCGCATSWVHLYSPS